jgi:hypothetical protein
LPRPPKEKPAVEPRAEGAAGAAVALGASRFPEVRKETLPLDGVASVFAGADEGAENANDTEALGSSASFTDLGAAESSAGFELSVGVVTKENLVEAESTGPVCVADALENPKVTEGAGAAAAAVVVVVAGAALPRGSSHDTHFTADFSFWTQQFLHLILSDIIAHKLLPLLVPSVAGLAVASRFADSWVRVTSD